MDNIDKSALDPHVTYGVMAVGKDDFMKRLRCVSGWWVDYKSALKDYHEYKNNDHFYNVMLVERSEILEPLDLEE